MKRNKVFNIFMLLFLSLLCLAPSLSFAECDFKEIEKKKNEAAQTALNGVISTLNNYNTLAEQYISSCNPSISRGMSVDWPPYALTAAININTSAGGVLTGGVYNTGIKWSAESPKDENCKAMRDKASNALDAYNKQRTTALSVFGLVAEKNIPKDCVCPENSETKECVSYANKVTEEAEKNSNSCELFSTYLAELSTCPLCPIFQTILDTDNDVAHLAWKAVSKPLKSVVISIFLIFLALETLKNMGNMTGAGLGSYLKSILGLGLKVTITVQCLDNSQYVYGYFISPVLQAGLDMGLAILGSGGNGAGQCATSSSGIATVNGGELDPGLLSSIMQTIRCFGNTAAILPAVGRGLICYSMDRIIPDLNMWLVGVIMYLGGLAIWLAIAFYLIDCTVQLGMVCALVPMCIACWPFKVTQRYSYIGVRLIMNVFFNFVVMGVVLLVGAEIVGAAAGNKSGNLEDYVLALNNNDAGRLKSLSNLDGEGILILVACMIFALKIIGMSNNLADKFASSSGSSIGAKMGGAAASAATSVGTAAGRSAMAVGKTAVKGALSDPGSPGGAPDNSGGSGGGNNGGGGSGGGGSGGGNAGGDSGGSRPAVKPQQFQGAENSQNGNSGSNQNNNSGGGNNGSTQGGNPSGGGS